MDESVISTMDNTAFFDNVTWLNQQNWQNYFGKTLPNGVIVDGSLKLSETGYTLSGTMDITTDENNIIIGSGAVMANGLYAENLLSVQIPHVTQAEATKFICVRFSLESANAKIICKTNVVGSNDTVQNVIRALNVDESYLCDRNPDVYEIPLAFESYNGSTLDLRRLVYAPSSEKHYLDLTSGKGNNSTAVPGVVRGKSHAQVFGGTTYFITIDSNDANSRFTLYPMFTNSTEPIIVCIQNNSGSTKDLTLSNSVNGFSISYEWIDSWQTSSYGKYTDFVSGSSKILVLFPAKITTSGASFGVLTKGTSEGGSVDPDSVYTKQEINNLLSQKANSSDVNSALSLKENISNLKALAYQDRVDYLTQIDNKPTLGALSDQDSVNYETEVTNKPTFGTLALKNSVNYETEVTNKPNIPNIINEYISNRIIYVNGANGDDTTGDGSPSNPYATIQKAIDSSANGVLTDIYVSGSASENEAYEENITISGKNLILRSNGTVRISDFYRINCITIKDNSSVIFTGIWKIYARDAVAVKDNSSLLVKDISSEFDIIHSDVNTYSYGISVSNNSRISIESNSFTITLTDKINNYKAISVSKNSSAYIAYLDIIDENTVYHADFVSKNSMIYYYNFKRNGNIDTPVTEVSDNGVINIPSEFGTLSSKDDVEHDNNIYGRRNGYWTSLAYIPSEFGTLSTKNDVENNNEVYVRKNGNWISLTRKKIKFYVDITGNDETGNGTSQNPYAHIQKAVDMVPYGFNAEIEIKVGEGYTTYMYPITVDGKNITFIKSSSGGIYINGRTNIDGTENILGAAITVINGANVHFESTGTWNILGRKNCIRVGEGSILTIDNAEIALSTNENNSCNFINVYDNSKLNIGNLTLEYETPSNNLYVYGVKVRTGSTAAFTNVTAIGIPNDSTCHSFSVESGIIWYGSYSGTINFEKKNGGLILTGSSN